MPLKCWQASSPKFIISFSFEEYCGMLGMIKIVSDKVRRGQSSTLCNDTDSCVYPMCLVTVAHGGVGERAAAHTSGVASLQCLLSTIVHSRQ